MGSTLKNEVGRALVLERVARSWDKCQGHTFGDMIVGALGERLSPAAKLELRLMSDEQVAELFERFALVGFAPSTPSPPKP